MDNANAYPLHWPTSWPRSKRRERSRFSVKSVWAASRDLRAELRRMYVPDHSIVISTNVELRQDGAPYANRRAPEDPGAAVYFKLKSKPRVLACDRWDRVEHNLRAISKHIEALRGQERWGVGTIDQAFSGYAALPERASEESCWSVLGIDPGASASEVREAYARKVTAAHPDNGGSTEELHRVREAYNDARGGSLRLTTGSPQ